MLQAGLSPRLRTLVDSEALLNDGSAYVLFYLLRVDTPIPAWYQAFRIIINFLQYTDACM